MCRAVVAALQREAITTNERRVLVLTGEPAATRSAAREILTTLECGPAAAAYVGPDDHLQCEHLDPSRSASLLGTSRQVVVLDGHERFEPNDLGRAVGAVDGGGLLVLLVPPLDAWPDRRDEFDETLAVPPFTVDHVTGHFRRRLVETLSAHRGIAIVECGADTRSVVDDGLTDPTPRCEAPAPTVPGVSTFPKRAYEACLTQDQCEALQALEGLSEGEVCIVESDRGRGKSSAAGLAAGSLAREGQRILVTAPAFRNAREVFARAAELLDADDGSARHLDAGAGELRYLAPVEAVEAIDEYDVVIVDEAAAIPVRLLEQFLAAPAVAFATTIHGYEGAGRGFSVRFRDTLAERDRDVTEVQLSTPIRYAPADPVEVWAHRALLLGANPPPKELVGAATPESVRYEGLGAQDLLADEHVLREAFGLLVLAHYRTEPNDLARVLDAPNVTLRVLTHEGHVVSVALLAREGDLPADVREHMYSGGRVRGNMLPDVLTTQLRDEEAGVPVGQRILRIATHHDARARGLGSHLLDCLRDEFASTVDCLGVGYGATPELVDFWADNGFRTVQVSTTRNERSGEYSAIMLAPTSDAGEALHDRHARWFKTRFPAMLSDPLTDLDPAVVRAVCRATAPPVERALSPADWRLVAGAATGAGLYDTGPGPFRELAISHLIDPAAETLLDDRQERLLVLKALQGHSWDVVAERLDYHSTSQCMRELGTIAGSLVETYGTDEARRELKRLQK
jgi:tRNA(Met) cytidine acetyltransferase